MRIGIFIGCFNPVHRAHICCAEKLLAEDYVQKIIFVPAGDRYKKDGLSKAEHRLAMLRLAIKNSANMEISEIEIQRGKMYSYQTLDYFKAKFPKDEICLIIGADNLKQFYWWKNNKYILSNYGLIVLGRGGLSGADFPEYRQYKNIEFVNTDILISSTKIRQEIVQKNYKEVANMLDSDVLEYIIKERPFKEQKNMKIEEKVYILLKKYNLKICAAESCTGGLLSGRLVNVSGASEILDMGFVTYSNEAKVELLGVKEATLKRYGAVSEQTAAEMAEGARLRARANIGLATSGIAGPTGGTKDKPVGMVCFGISVNGEIYSYTNIFKNISRQYIRNSSVNFILKKLLEILNKTKKDD